MKMREYPSVNDVQNGDILVINRENIGTRKMSVEDFISAVKGKGVENLAESKENRRLLVRGKNLGTSVTAEQEAAIKAGTFDDIYLADYWEIGGYIWIVADFNYWFGTGDYQNGLLYKPHLVIVPATHIGNGFKMNSSRTSDGGYLSSELRTSGLGVVKNIVRSAFGSLLLTHDEYLINAVYEGRPTGGIWVQSDVELMNEQMVYGGPVYQAMGVGNGGVTKYTIDKSQLALFQARPDLIIDSSNTSYWLRDIVGPGIFACVYHNGVAADSYCDWESTIRPVFAIG